MQGLLSKFTLEGVSADCGRWNRDGRLRLKTKEERGRREARLAGGEGEGGSGHGFRREARQRRRFGGYGAPNPKPKAPGERGDQDERVLGLCVAEDEPARPAPWLAALEVDGECG